MEDGGGGDSADARMPDDVGDEIEDDGDLVRVESAIEHPRNAKGIGNKSSPVGFLLLKDQGYVFAQNDLHLFTLFVGSGEHAWLAFGSGSWLKVGSAGLCGSEGANGFPNAIRQTPAKDGQEGWSNRAGDNKDDTQDLSGDDGD